jgi:hypothetical protein
VLSMPIAAVTAAVLIANVVASTSSVPGHFRVGSSKVDPHARRRADAANAFKHSVLGRDVITDGAFGMSGHFSSMLAQNLQGLAATKLHATYRERDRCPTLQTRRKAIARATDLGRVLIAPPSFPLCTIHSPFDACPVMMPT